MKGQVALEMLFAIAIMAVAVLLFYSGAVSQKNLITDKTVQIQQLKDSSEVGSSVSTEFNCMVRSSPTFNSIYFKIVDDKIAIRNKARWIATDWVISNDTREPD